MCVLSGMILKFGGRLMEDLLDLKQRTEMLVSTDPSIGSGALSVGSDYPHQDLLAAGRSPDSDSEEG